MPEPHDDDVNDDNDDNDVTDPVCAAVPVLGVERGHVAEAKRALAEQGRNVEDDAVIRLLWAARALPVALDVLSDARSPFSLGRVMLSGARIELAGENGHALLVAVARFEGSEVIVDFIERKALLLAADGDEAPAICTVSLPFQALDEKGNATNVAVHRFTLGPAA